MKHLQLFSLILTMIFTSQLSAQSIRIGEKEKGLGFDVFVMPGIGPEGDKIFKFSFAGLSAFNGHVSSDSVAFISSTGKNLNLFKPIKPAAGNTKVHSGTFALSAEEVALLKGSDLATLVLFINGERKNIDISAANAAAIKSVAQKNF